MTMKLKINGQEVEAEAGESVIDVARRNGFEIPSLCHHEAVVPYGACRVCLVEIKKGGRSKLTTSCNYEVQEGIEVTTESAAIRRHRGMVLELILAEAPESDVVKKLAASYGVTKSRFSRGDVDVSHERGKCILCGLCARVCTEVVGVSALSFNGRGDGRGVGGPYQEEPQACIACGACAWVCPTDCIGIEDKGGMRRLVKWNRTLPLVGCSMCGAPVITAEHRQHAVSRGGLPADYYTLCASCKKKNLSARFAAVGA